MDNEDSLREHIVQLLKGGGAHVHFEGAVKDLPANVRGARPEGVEHSLWQLLEHIRIAQWDILEFTRDPRHKSPKFPDGYWPLSPEPPSAASWDKTVAAIRSDLKSMIEIVENKSTDLLSKLPHGDGQTIFREALLIADHNAYHIGQFIFLRRLLGVWQ